MTKLIRASLLLLLCSTIQFAKAQEVRHNSTKLAYNLVESQGDFGLGIQLETPSIINDMFTLKLRANQMFLNYDQLDRNKWSPYWSLSLGLSSNPVFVSDQISLYGEGGATYLIPDSDFSSSDGEWAGYGLFGFNFHFAPQFCYFLEAGASGSGAEAEKSDNQRMYANGFLINVGFKMMFGGGED